MKNKTIANDGKRHFADTYQNRYGVIAGFLPEEAKHLGEWLSLQVELAREHKKASGAAYSYQPSIEAFKNYLDSHLDMKINVDQMILEGKKVHELHESDYYYGINTLNDLYITMNYIIQNAPKFAYKGPIITPKVKQTAFPMSALFVYMMYTETGSQRVFNNMEFNRYLTNILNAWCTYLDSPASLNVINTGEEGWLSKASVIKNNLDQFVTEEQKIADPKHWGFKSYNDFFHRDIIKICRPVDGVDNKAVIVSPNDGTVNRLSRNVPRSAQFWVKGQPYSLVNMLNDSEYTHRFVGGDVLQTFLSGHDYHRFHAPITGKLVKMEKVSGYLFSELRSEGFDFSAGTLSQEYEASVNTRALFFIESDDPKIGMVCVMPIGITEISSIRFNDCLKENDYVTKGQLLGRFSYGGSSLCVLFQPGAIEQFTVVNPNHGTDGNDGPFVRVNAQIAIANQSFVSTKQVVDHLQARLSSESDFAQLLLASINQAKDEAYKNMDPKLFEVLSWPTTLVDYIVFLIEFSRWKPQQSDHPAWQKPGAEQPHAEEVYDRLCHFYWLIDQKVGPNGTKIVQNIEGFDQWLVDYANLWGSFLNTPESFNEEILESFRVYSPQYRVEDSLINGKPNNPSGWLTFNQFFARELNPGLRPIASPSNNKVIVSPADCTYRNQFSIASDSTVPAIYVKKTHKYASITDLLKGSKYADAFGGGTFVHYFLGPYSYHRFHAPVAGMVEECYAVQGLTYLEVNLVKHQFDAPDDGTGGYEFSQARGVITIDTRDSIYGNVGIVAVIPVGMCQVSSVNMTATTGQSLLKGEEFGYFLFGGSDIILLFQEGVDPVIATEQVYRYYGTDLSVAVADKE